MKADSVKLLFTYTITLAILAGGFYALVIYKFELDQLVKGALIGFMGMSINFLYGEQVATRTSYQQQASSASGAAQALSTPTITTTAGPPATTTVSSPEPVLPTDIGRG